MITTATVTGGIIGAATGGLWMGTGIALGTLAVGSLFNAVSRYSGLGVIRALPTPQMKQTKEACEVYCDYLNNLVSCFQSYNPNSRVTHTQKDWMKMATTLPRGLDDDGIRYLVNQYGQRYITTLVLMRKYLEDQLNKIYRNESRIDAGLGSKPVFNEVPSKFCLFPSQDDNREYTIGPVEEAQVKSHENSYDEVNQSLHTSHNPGGMSNHTQSKTWNSAPDSNRTRSKSRKREREIEMDVVDSAASSKRLKNDNQLMHNPCEENGLPQKDLLEEYCKADDLHQTFDLLPYLYKLRETKLDNLSKETCKQLSVFTENLIKNKSPAEQKAVYKQLLSYLSLAAGELLNEEDNIGEFGEFKIEESKEARDLNNISYFIREDEDSNMISPQQEDRLLRIEDYNICFYQHRICHEIHFLYLELKVKKLLYLMDKRDTRFKEGKLEQVNKALLDGRPDHAVTLLNSSDSYISGEDGVEVMKCCAQEYINNSFKLIMRDKEEILNELLPDQKILFEKYIHNDDKEGAIEFAYECTGTWYGKLPK